MMILQFEEQEKARTASFQIIGATYHTNFLWGMHFQEMQTLSLIVVLLLFFQTLIYTPLD